MNEFEVSLNELLVNTFRSILKVEEKALCGRNNINLSISEMHMLEAIGTSNMEAVKVSMVSKLMDITLPSTTVAINKLVSKGFLIKEKCNIDRRVMYVRLTELGEKVNRAHSFFHNKMVREVAKDMNEEERAVLLKGIEKINTFFKKTLENR